MKCSNCGFQNLPGSEACGRCTSSLGLATAVMDVHPPRAGSAAKLGRRLFPVRRTWLQMRDALDGIPIEQAASRITELSWPRPAILMRLIVPGWSHCYLNQRFRGYLFFWGFIGCLVPWILMYGSGWGSIWLGMAFSVHSSAALDIFTQNAPDADVRERISFSVIVSVLLAIVVYVPGYFLLEEFAQPHVVQTSMGAFRPDDVLVVNRWPNPRRGDVVLYSLDYSVNAGEQIGHERIIRQYFGENIDRILAVSGDVVQCEGGKLMVNGTPSPWLPLNACRLPDKFNCTVPPSRYLIIPSGVPGFARTDDPNLWQTAVNNITRENIVGRPYFQTSPLSRFHIIH